MNRPPPNPEYFAFLWRKSRPQVRFKRGLLEVVPLVNIVLLLFLFIISASSFVIQPGVTMDLPTAPFESGAGYGDLVVALAGDGLLLYNDERIDLPGLAGVFARATRENPETRLLIEADSRVEHGTLMKIYNMARAAGVAKVTLATRPAASEEKPSAPAVKNPIVR